MEFMLSLDEMSDLVEPFGMARDEKDFEVRDFFPDGLQSGEELLFFGRMGGADRRGRGLLRSCRVFEGSEGLASGICFMGDIEFEISCDKFFRRDAHREKAVGGSVRFERREDRSGKRVCA